MYTRISFVVTRQYIGSRLSEIFIGLVEPLKTRFSLFKNTIIRCETTEKYRRKITITKNSITCLIYFDKSIIQSLVQSFLLYNCVPFLDDCTHQIFIFLLWKIEASCLSTCQNNFFGNLGSTSFFRYHHKRWHNHSKTGIRTSPSSRERIRLHVSSRR